MSESASSAENVTARSRSDERVGPPEPCDPNATTNVMSASEQTDSSSVASTCDGMAPRSTRGKAVVRCKTIPPAVLGQR